MGFEPTDAFTSLVFKTRAFNHSTTFPSDVIIILCIRVFCQVNRPDILEFEVLLFDLGYRDKSKLILKPEKLTKQMTFTCDSGSIAFYGWIVPYYNKKSYLFTEFLEYYGQDDIEDRIKRLIKKIRYEEENDNGIGDVGWDAIYSKSPEKFTNEERTRMYMQWASKGSNFFKGDFYGLNPKPGDMLAARPQGPKINEGFTENSIELGTRQRALIARRYGFGYTYEDGFQYARYNDDLELEPV